VVLLKNQSRGASQKHLQGKRGRGSVKKRNKGQALTKKGGNELASTGRGRKGKKLEMVQSEPALTRAASGANSTKTGREGIKKTNSGKKQKPEVRKQRTGGIMKMNESLSEGPKHGPAGQG